MVVPHLWQRRIIYLSCICIFSITISPPHTGQASPGLYTVPSCRRNTAVMLTARISSPSQYFSTSACACALFDISSLSSLSVILYQIFKCVFKCIFKREFVGAKNAVIVFSFHIMPIAIPKHRVFVFKQATYVSRWQSHNLNSNTLLLS